jgi:hypothetical protein
MNDLQHSQQGAAAPSQSENQARIAQLAYRWGMQPRDLYAWLADELLCALDSNEDECGYFRRLHSLKSGMERDASELRGDAESPAEMNEGISRELESAS